MNAETFPSSVIPAKAGIQTFQIFRVLFFGSFVFKLKSQIEYGFEIKVIILSTRIEADFCMIHTDKTLLYQ